jgi:peroxiredoxin family protein
MPGMKMQLKETHPTNLEELKVEIKKQWVFRMDDSQYLKKLMESMTDRIQERSLLEMEMPPTTRNVCVYVCEIYVNICIF